MSTLDYGVIGNCKTAALISLQGSIDWLCFPDFDSPSIFARILDEQKGGSFGFVLPEDCVCSQKYITNTNILVTTFACSEWAFETVDFMPRYRTSESDYNIPPEVYRLLRPLRGEPRFRIRFDLRMDYARSSMGFTRLEDCILCSSWPDGSENVYLYSSIPFDLILEDKEIVLTQEHFFLLSYNQKIIRVDRPRVYLEFERTKVYWLNWANRSVKMEKYEDIVSRSLLVLKLMTFEYTGAILAALTTSIPEGIGESRNWDYRYCWLRDASMSVNTLQDMGHRYAAKRFLRFIHRVLRTKHDRFQIMYGIRGERVLTEEKLEHLDGFAGSKPVRIGNSAYAQQQNDVFGYLLDVVESYYRDFGGSLGEVEEMWEVVKNIARTVMQEWRNPDSSIWEFRGRRDHFVFSKIMCWVAMDRASRIAELLGCPGDQAFFRNEADTIRQDVLDKGWNGRLGSFTQAYGNEEMDASLLLMEQYGFIAPDDKRYVSTVKRLHKELMYNGLMFRYRGQDDFGTPGTAFTICSFWLVRALFVIGKQEEAVAVFDEVISHANHVGLLSEDLDFRTKKQLGNFPQAYSHLALIDVAALLDRQKFWPRIIRP